MAAHDRAADVVHRFYAAPAAGSDGPASTIPNIIDYLDIAPTFGLEKIRPPRDYVGKTLRELDLQARLQLTPIALRRGDNVIVNPHRDERIGEADELVLIGRTTTSSSCASSPREMWAGLGPARAAAAPSVERRFLGQDPAATALVVGDSAAR